MKMKIKNGIYCIKINCKYEEDLSLVNFQEFENWGCFEGYAYSFKDFDIKESLIILENPTAKKIVEKEIFLDWQDALELRQAYEIPDYLKDTCRILGLAESILTNGIKPVSIDTFNTRSPSKLEGHHRLLSLKYLGFDYFPAFLEGYTEELLELKPFRLI